MCFKRLYTCLLLLFFSFYMQAQGDKRSGKALKVGDVMPDLVLKNLSGYPSVNGAPTRLSHFKGKLVILDFWGSTCTSCIKAFPKMEQLQQEFGDKVQVILVNPSENEEKIRKTFDAKKKAGVAVVMPALPQVNGDSVWRMYFPARTIPHHVWINDKGIIIAITGGYNATPQNVTAVLKGEKVRMLLKPNTDRFPENGYPLSVCPGSKGIQPSEYTWFSNYYEGEGADIYGYADSFKYDPASGSYKSIYINNSFIDIFKEVYRKGLQGTQGKYAALSNDRIIWEVPGAPEMQRPVDNAGMDAWALKNKFCMEISVPASERDSLAGKTLLALNSYIGHRFGVKGAFVKKEGSDDIVLKITTK